MQGSLTQDKTQQRRMVAEAYIHAPQRQPIKYFDCTWTCQQLDFAIDIKLLLITHPLSIFVGPRLGSASDDLESQQCVDVDGGPRGLCQVLAEQYE